MKKLMVLVVLLAVALIAAPAIAQKEESTTPDTPGGGPPSDGPVEPLPTTSHESPPPNAAPGPEDPAPAGPPTEPTALEFPPKGPTALKSPLEDGNPVADTGDNGTSPGPVTSIDPDIGDGPGGSTRDDDVEDAGKDADDEITKDEIDNSEAREDRIADRILADLKDGKKDEDDDEDDTNKDDVEQSQDQDADSGDVDQDADVINTGDNVNQCVGILQVANTGNAQNATGINQFDSESDEIEIEDGSRITLTPQLVVDCRQIILQIVRGERPNESNISNARLREVIQPRSGAAQAVRTGAGVIAPSSRSGITATPKVLSASSAGRPAGQPKTSARSLPRTGGSYATLLGLGTGALLVGGGLLVRRLAR
jgi:hypothetical protein